MTDKPWSYGTVIRSTLVKSTLTCKVVNDGEVATAIVDSALIARIYDLERQGISVIDLPDAFGEGVNALALVRRDDPAVPIVMVPVRKQDSETKLLRSLLSAYDLDQMPVTHRRQ